MIRLPTVRALLVTVPVALLLSCAQVPVVLWTDVAEIAPAVEAFNASQESRVVEITFVPDVSTELRLTQETPDLVISRFIEDQSTSQFFQPLDGLVRREISREVFYPQLLETGRRNSRQLLLPVGFNLPLVYFPEPVPPVDRELILDSDSMRERASSFNQGTGERWTNLAFSPIWEEQFLYQYLRANGFIVTEGPDGQPLWETDAVSRGLADVNAWVEQANGSLALDLEFSERYLYAPELQLVRSGRIAYGYSESDEYLSLTDDQRSGLGFRWYGESNEIQVLENVVFSAIPQNARNVPGAQEFLIFLFTESQQVEIMEESLDKQIDAFGIAGGFSSLWRVTERELERFYPELSGMIPPQSALAFSPPSPRHWGSLIVETVQPWLYREATGQPQGRDLRNAVRAWLLQQEQ